MTTEVKNLFFPVPKHEANTLASLNMSESYEAGTLNFVPTMAPILAGEAGRRLESSKAEETLEELDESLEYIKCVGRCKRRLAVLTHTQRLRLNAVSRGAHGDALYGRTPEGGGSLHDAVRVQRARERSARQDRARAQRDAALRQEGFEEAKSEQRAALLERGQKAAQTKRMKAELIDAGFNRARFMKSGDEIAQYYQSVMSRENIARRESMKSLSTDPNAERQEPSFAHRDAGGTYRAPDEPAGMGAEAVEDIDRDLVVPGQDRLPAHFEGLGGGLTEPDGAGLFP